MPWLERILYLVNERRPWAGNFLCLLFGLLMPLAFAPFEWRWLTVPSLAGLLLLARQAAPGRAALRTFIHGLGMFGFGISWVYNSLHDFGSASFFVAALITAALVLACSAVHAGCMALYARWRGASLLFNSLLLFPAAWITAEWVRSWILSGFPWLLLGYSQVDSLLSGYAPVVGTLGLGFDLAVLAGAVVVALLGAMRQRLAAGCAAAVILLAGVLLHHVSWVESSGGRLKAALIQGNIPQELKMRPDQLAHNIAHYQQLSHPHYDSDLIVWPETAIPSFKHRVEEMLQPFYLDLNRYGAELITGVFVYDFERKLYYNSLYKLGSDEVYSKQHLVPFGEYMPLRGLLEFMNRFINIPMSDIAPAVNLGLMPVAGHTAGLSICYESAYASIFRRQLPQAEFFVNASNDAWFGDSLAPHQHLEIARMRALESGRYLLRATNNGISAVIAPDGKIVQRSPQFMDSVISAEIETMGGMTPYAAAGDWPVLLLAAAVLLGGWVRRRRG
ncbi:MAG TPA: apolipoprotein N-acyltransferase [Gammaproteobacteria bacterium]|nr:apolipoprotein N-acyltransferase [Gammaproteobacteria bacterium]